MEQSRHPRLDPMIELRDKERASLPRTPGRLDMYKPEPNAKEEPNTESVDWGSHSIKFLVKRSIQDLPAPPAILTRILRETENTDSSAADLERLISTDQALAARVLKVVNSAYYGLSGKVSSLSQAVVILGIQQIRNLALSITSLSMIKASTSRQRELQRRFWLHALGTAFGAQAIGKRRHIGARCVETLYVTGLLHDIGRLFLFTNFTETHIEAAARAKKEGRPLRDIEHEIFGICHAEIGGELGRLWNFPPSIIEGLELHHGPFNADSDPRLLALNVADAIAEWIYEDCEVEATLDPFAQEWAGIDSVQLEALGELIRAQVQACDSAYFQMAA